jgi:hypothetical protein
MDERESLRRIFARNPKLKDFLYRKYQRGELKSFEDLPAEGDDLIVVAGPDSGGITGSLQTKCEGCGLIVWLSPSTQEMMRGRDRTTIQVCCMPCAIKKAQDAE